MTTTDLPPTLHAVLDQLARDLRDPSWSAPAPHEVELVKAQLRHAGPLGEAAARHHRFAETFTSLVHADQDRYAALLEQIGGRLSDLNRQVGDLCREVGEIGQQVRRIADRPEAASRPAASRTQKGGQ